MIEPVFEHVIAAAHQYGGHGEVRHVTRRKQQGARTRDELGEFCFERVMFGVVTAHEVRRAAAHAPPVRGVAEGRDDPRVVRKPQVIVAAEAGELAAIHEDARAFARFHRPAVAEVPPGPPVLQTLVAEIYGPSAEVQRELTREFFMAEQQKVVITFSAGVTPLGAGESMESALKRADAAMYQAKQAGRNRVMIAPLPAANATTA
mgnify:CR=1 FL=1